MDKKIRYELLKMILIQPSLLVKMKNKYFFDLNFYKMAVSMNIDVYLYLPDEYKNNDNYNEEFIDIVLRHASTNHLDFPYKDLKFYNHRQKLEIYRIKSIICYIKLYKIIYGVDRKFGEELLFSSITDNNTIFTNIKEPLMSLSDEERNYIIYKYGLIDGKVKTKDNIMKYYHFGYDHVCELDKIAMRKLDRYARENKYRLLGYKK